MIRLLILFVVIFPPVSHAGYYEVLGLDPNAEDREVHEKYRAIVKTCHPDKNPEREKEAAVRFKEVQDAYDVLGDKKKRAEYDRILGIVDASFTTFSMSDPESFLKTSSVERRTNPRTGGSVYDVHHMGRTSQYPAERLPSDVEPWMPSDAHRDSSNGKWFTYGDGGKKIYFDPRTGFLETFKYSPKTRSDASGLFDKLLNPTSVGRRRDLIEKAEELSWNPKQRIDFVERAKEVLRSIEDLPYPTDENIRRMRAVFDLPFIREFPDLIAEFLETHSNCRYSFQERYLTDRDWMADPNFDTIFVLARRHGERGLPLSIYGSFHSSPGKKTGIWATFRNRSYEVHDIIDEHTIDYEAFKRWWPLLKSEISVQDIGSYADRLSSFFNNREGADLVLPEILDFMNSAAFEEAEKGKDPYTGRMIRLLREKLDAHTTKFPRTAIPLMASDPDSCPKEVSKSKKSRARRPPRKS